MIWISCVVNIIVNNWRHFFKRGFCIHICTVSTFTFRFLLFRHLLKHHYGRDSVVFLSSLSHKTIGMIHCCVCSWNSSSNLIVIICFIILHFNLWVQLLIEILCCARVCSTYWNLGQVIINIVVVLNNCLVRGINLDWGIDF